MVALYVSATLVAIYLCLRLSWVFPRAKGIPVLMYHDLHGEHSDRLTLKSQDFAKQLAWLKASGYQTVSLEEFLTHHEGRLARSAMPAKPLLITIDDGYRSSVEKALPVLRQHQFRATMFSCTRFTEEREQGLLDKAISIAELKTWTDAGMDIALHSHSHANFSELAADEIVSDLQAQVSRLTQWKIPFHLALAYPFGARPTSRRHKRAFEATLSNYGIRAAFRIGNRVQPFFPSRRGRFAIYRIGVRGYDRFFDFKTKVRKGLLVRV